MAEPTENDDDRQPDCRRCGTGSGVCPKHARAARSERDRWNPPDYSPLEIPTGEWRLTLPGGEVHPIVFQTEDGALGAASMHKVLVEQHAKPIPMLLWCPECGTRHIDIGEFAHKPHHTHACQNCGMTWRPAVVATVGVRFLPGFRNVDPDDPWSCVGCGEINRVKRTRCYACGNERGDV